MGGVLGAMLVNWVGVFKRCTEMGETLGAILVIQTGYLSGALKWV
jgi:hypothetical protein